MFRYLIPVVLAAGIVAASAAMKDPCSQEKTIRIYDAVTGKVEKLPVVCKTDDEWKALLTPEQYSITLSLIHI